MNFRFYCPECYDNTTKVTRTDVTNGPHFKVSHYVTLNSKLLNI